LIDYLSKSRDLTDRHKYMDLLVGMGASAIPTLIEATSRGTLSMGITADLLEKILRGKATEEAGSALEAGLDQGRPQAVRLLAVRFLRKYFQTAGHIARTLLSLARNKNDDPVVRRDALGALVDVSLPTADFSHLSALLGDSNVEVVLAGLDIFSAHASRFSGTGPHEALEALTRHKDLGVRCRAITLLGTFAEIDILGGWCFSLTRSR
jgi:hypothetical protein